VREHMGRKTVREHMGRKTVREHMGRKTVREHMGRKTVREHMSRKTVRDLFSFSSICILLLSSKINCRLVIICRKQFTFSTCSIYVQTRLSDKKLLHPTVVLPYFSRTLSSHFLIYSFQAGIETGVGV